MIKLYALLAVVLLNGADASIAPILPSSMPNGKLVGAPCLHTVRRLVSDLTRFGGRFDVREHPNFGLIAWLPAGPLTLQVKQCTQEGSLSEAELYWYQRAHAIDFYALRGSVRHVRLSIENGQPTLSAWDSGGRRFQRALPSTPSGLGILFHGSRPSFSFGYNNSEDGWAIYIDKRSLRLTSVFEGGPTPPP